jgi:hypothetical protein
MNYIKRLVEKKMLKAVSIDDKSHCSNFPIRYVKMLGLECGKMPYTREDTGTNQQQLCILETSL